MGLSEYSPWKRKSHESYGQELFFALVPEEEISAWHVAGFTFLSMYHHREWQLFQHDSAKHTDRRDACCRSRWLKQIEMKKMTQ